MTGRNIRSHQQTGTCVHWAFRCLLWLTVQVKYGTSTFNNAEFDSLFNALSIANADERRKGGENPDHA